MNDSSYSGGHDYLSFVESLSFPVTIKIMLAPVSGRNSSRMLARYIADRKSEIRFSKGMGELKRNNIRMQIRDLEDMAKRTAEGRSSPVNAFISYRVSSEHPVKLRESGATFTSIMGLMGFRISPLRYFTRKFLEKMASPLMAAGNAYLMDTHASSSILPVAFTKLPGRGGVAAGVDDLTEKPVFLDLFGKSSHNALIFGETGSGKSFFSKTVLMRYWITGEAEEIVIVDPLNEYFCNMFQGGCQEVNLEPGSVGHGGVDFNSGSGGGKKERRVIIYKTGSAVEHKDSGLLESLLHRVYNRMEKSEPIRRIILVDEAHLILYNRETQELLSRLVRHSRHYTTSVICVTQNMDDMSGSRLSSVIAENSSTVLLFRSKSVSTKDRQRFGLAAFGELHPEELIGGKKAPYSECYLMEENGLRKVRIISTQMEVDLISRNSHH